MKKNKKYIIPNLVTVFNMFLGFLAIGMLMRGEPIKAGWLILFAGMFDAIDGKIARLLGIPSKFGTEFDSFADTVSFCVAPSVMIYTIYAQQLPMFLGGLISFIPLLFGTIRLARFNLLEIDKTTPSFIGLTTPLNALLLFGYMLFCHRLYGNFGDPRIAILLVFIMGLLMISPIKFHRFPLLSFKKGKENSFQLLGVFIVLFSIILLRGLILFPLLIIYIFYCLGSWIIKPQKTGESLSYRNSQKGKFIR